MQKAVREIVRRLDAALAVLLSIRGDLDRLSAGESPGVPPDAISNAKKGICLFCGKVIDAGRKVRGCHKRCYRVIKREIESGTSEERFISSGKILPAGTGGRPANPALANLLEEIAPLVAEAKRADQAYRTARNAKTK